MLDFASVILVEPKSRAPFLGETHIEFTQQTYVRVHKVN